MPLLLVLCATLLALPAGTAWQTCSKYRVTGAGDADANGVYLQATDSVEDSVPYYYRFSSGAQYEYLFRAIDPDDGRMWIIMDSDQLTHPTEENVNYYATSSTTTPAVTGWASHVGAAPVPRVNEVISDLSWNSTSQSCQRICDASNTFDGTGCGSVVVKSAGSTEVDGTYELVDGALSDCVGFYTRTSTSDGTVVNDTTPDTERMILYREISGLSRFWMVQSVAQFKDQKGYAYYYWAIEDAARPNVPPRTGWSSMGSDAKAKPPVAVIGQGAAPTTELQGFVDTTCPQGKAASTPGRTGGAMPAPGSTVNERASKTSGATAVRPGAGAVGVGPSVIMAIAVWYLVFVCTVGG